MEPPTRKHDIGGISFDDDEYTVKQSHFRNKYKVYDSAGNLVLKSKQKLFKMKEEFPFFDADGNTVFRVKAKSVLDVAGDYVLVDERTDEPVIVLSKNFTFFHHHWTIKRPDGTEVAEVASRSAVTRSAPVVLDAVLVPAAQIFGYRAERRLHRRNRRTVLAPRRVRHPNRGFGCGVENGARRGRSRHRRAGRELKSESELRPSRATSHHRLRRSRRSGSRCRRPRKSAVLGPCPRTPLVSPAVNRPGTRRNSPPRRAKSR